MIREARPDEADVLADVQRRASLAAFAHVFPPDRYPFPIEEVRQRWRAALADPARSVHVAEQDGEVVGVALIGPGWLDGFYVVPESWGHGVGSALHDDALVSVRAESFDCCHLWVLEQNDRARRFYERRDWRENGRTRVVPFPPNPLDVGYTIDLEPRLTP